MDNIVDGFKLMVIGMGMVFIFLIIMVFVISFMAKILAPYAHLLEEKTVAATGPGASKKASTTKSDDIISAIVAAVHKYRSER
jgi:oxaloacetate decarboxylase (Na+ extruding) subunit gamma